ncbi:MAG: hypothetical protein ABUL48_03550, partial [Pseudorhodoplanes sp.]
MSADTASARDLDNLHAQILRDPTNSEINLRFARLAEASGTMRWALAAYERVLLNDPNNMEAKMGLMRVRRILQPAFTLVTAEFGGIYESNPNYYMPGNRGELQAFGSLSVRDERNLAGTRWRTTGTALGTVHQHEGDLNYGVVGLDTGPVIDLYPGLSVHPALGAAAAYFADHFYYAEGAASATFESSFEGAYRALRLKAAYRSYDDYFPTQQGFYYEARGRLATPGILGDGSVAILAPWLLWSDISGKITNALVTEIQPGAYTEYGGRLEVYKQVADWLTLGANVALSKRDYRTDVIAGTSEKRDDVLFSPGATV